MIITEVTWTVTASGFRVPFRAVEGVNHFATPLTYDSFTTGASDYDTEADEIYCPCGVTLPWDASIGSAIRTIADHCKSYAHPLPIIDLEPF